MLLLPDGREFARVLVNAPAPEQMTHDGRSWRRREKTLLGRWTYQLIPARLRRRRKLAQRARVRRGQYEIPTLQCCLSQMFQEPPAPIVRRHHVVDDYFGIVL